MNFPNFKFDATEKLRIINLSRYWSKIYASAVPDDSEVTFFKEKKDIAFCSSLHFIPFIYHVAKSKSRDITFLCLLYF